VCGACGRESHACNAACFFLHFLFRLIFARYIVLGIWTLPVTWITLQLHCLPDSDILHMRFSLVGVAGLWPMIQYTLGRTTGTPATWRHTWQVGQKDYSERLHTGSGGRIANECAPDGMESYHVTGFSVLHQHINSIAVCSSAVRHTSVALQLHLGAWMFGRY